MSDVPVLLERHAGFEASFDAGGLEIPPRLSTVILTCVDTRLDPAHLFELELGDALVIRNTGGRVTPGVLTDLAVLTVLSANWPGAARLELLVVQHTNCGMQRLVDFDVQQRVAERAPVLVGEIAGLAISDPAVSVRDDVALVRQAFESHPISVTGMVYDVTDGSLTKVA